MMTKREFVAAVKRLHRPYGIVVGYMPTRGKWDVWLLSRCMLCRLLAQTASERVANKHAAKYRRWLAELETEP